VFQGFTERAQQVFVLADDEARRLKHAYIGTEHFLLGLIREDAGLAARTLSSLGLEVDRVRSDVVRMVGLGDEDVAADELHLTPRMETIVELAYAEADAAGVKVVGTEHLLLALAGEGHGIANVLLVEYGATSEDVRARVTDLGSSSGRRPN
jgi:ATP-dependent Clp protease ATP-binding subunit ClpC